MSSSKIIRPLTGSSKPSEKENSGNAKSGIKKPTESLKPKNVFRDLFHKKKPTTVAEPQVSTSVANKPTVVQAPAPAPVALPATRKLFPTGPSKLNIAHPIHSTSTTKPLVFANQVPSPQQSRPAVEMQTVVTITVPIVEDEKAWTLDDFDIGCVLGSGQFGKVYLAREKKSGFVLALKMFYKDKITEGKMANQILREIKIQMKLR